MKEKDVAEECGLSEQATCRFRQMLDHIMSWAHQYRRQEAEGTLDFMQVDETFFSKIKVGGTNRNRRVRQAGSDIAQTLCETSRDGKLKEIFTTPVSDKKGETLIPLVAEMARGHEPGYGRMGRDTMLQASPNIID